MEANHPEAVPVTLGGRERTVKLTLGALDIAATRHRYRFSAATLVTLSYDHLPRLVWAGLLPDEPGLEFEEVARWMGEDVEAGAEAAEAALMAFSRLTPLLKALRALAPDEGADDGGAVGKALVPNGAAAPAP